MNKAQFILSKIYQKKGQLQKIEADPSYVNTIYMTNYLALSSGG